MKILAIETELKKLSANSDKEILKEEALAVLELQQKDILCEIYFDENHCAVLMLECPDKTEAGKILSDLPLVKNGFITATNRMTRKHYFQTGRGLLAGLSSLPTLTPR